METGIDAVVVAGGGIAGIQASLDLAAMGYRVYLVERSAAIGGTMPMLGRTFPTNDCAMCILSPKLAECGRHPLITVLTNAEVLDVTGEPGHFTVTVDQQCRGVDMERCTGCGECAAQCPVYVDDPFNQELNGRKAIYKLYPQAFPNCYAIDRENCINCRACMEACPGGAVSLETKTGQMQLTAGAVILCPGFGLLNPARLEPYRYRQLYPSVLTSLEFERLLSSSGPYQGRLIHPSDEKEVHRVAWIQCAGSRETTINRELCSGVCCMYALKQAMVVLEQGRNMQATIFYQDMRTYGKGFENYYHRAKEMGIRLIRNRPAEIKQAGDGSRNLRVNYLAGDGTLMQEEFDLVVLSTGMVAPVMPLAEKLDLSLNSFGFCAMQPLSGIETSRPGIFAAGAFTGPRDIPDTVTQASAAAGAAAALLGSASRRERPPVEERDVEGDAPRTGVFVCRCGGNISRVVDVLQVARYARQLPGVVYVAEFSYCCAQDSLKTMAALIDEHRLNRVVVAACTVHTHEPLFQNLLRESGLNHHLFEMANIREHCSWVHMHQPEMATAKAKDLIKMAVARAALLQPVQGVSLGMTRQALVVGGGAAGMTAALNLAGRGHRVHLVEKNKHLGGMAGRLHIGANGEDVQGFLSGLITRVHEQELITIHTGAEITAAGGFVGNFVSTLSSGEEITHGVTIIATGAGEHRPEEYLYGADGRVMTLLELEGALAAGDSRVNGAGRFVFIQCVGSRDDRRPYCSRTCCTQSVRLALQIKAINPEAKIYVLYRDMRTYSFFEELYQEARRRGVVFIRYNEGNKPTVAAAGEHLRVDVLDDVLGAPVTIEADLAGLAAAMEAPAGNARLSRLYKVPLNQDGFFLEAHMKLRPVDFSTDGVFMCGLAHGPKNLEESIIQAGAAATRAAALLAGDKITVEGRSAFVSKRKCTGCGTCASVCPAGAVAVDGNEKVAVVNAALCKGCGVCAASCLRAAIDVKGFTNEQVMAAIRAL